MGRTFQRPYLRFSAFSGFSGFSTFSGFSGFSGFSAFSGFSGFSVFLFFLVISWVLLFIVVEFPYLPTWELRRSAEPRTLQRCQTKM